MDLEYISLSKSQKYIKKRNEGRHWGFDSRMFFCFLIYTIRSIQNDLKPNKWKFGCAPTKYQWLWFLATGTSSLVKIPPNRISTLNTVTWARRKLKLANNRGLNRKQPQCTDLCHFNQPLQLLIIIIHTCTYANIKVIRCLTSHWAYLWLDADKQRTLTSWWQQYP